MSWNTRDVIGTCLESLLADAAREPSIGTGDHGEARSGEWHRVAASAAPTPPAQARSREIIVVDNASADGSADLVERHFPTARLLREPSNLGFAAGVNAGLHLSAGELVLLLNCDTVVHPGAIDRLANVLQEDGELVAAGGCLVDERGAPQHGFHARRFPTLATWLVDLWLIDKVWPNNPISRRYLARDQTAAATGPVDVDQPAAACLMVRRSAIDRIGGLDERFFPAWFEDVDLCLRLKAAGGRIVFVPDARFTHRGGEAMRALGLEGFSRTWYTNLRRYVRKHQGPAAELACRLLIVTGMLPRVLVSLARLRVRDAVAYARVGLDALKPLRGALA